MVFLNFLINFFLFTMSCIAVKNLQQSVAESPIVKLAKGITHKSVYNGTGSVEYYSFNGIQYGRVLDRFSPPAPICHKSFFKRCPKENPNISKPRLSNNLPRGYPKCPQAIPDWMTFKNEKHLEKKSIKIPDNEVEDCLFLDVIVPKKVWDQTHDHSLQSFAPVLVWIHDGGFTSGSRILHEDPSILLKRSLEIHGEGTIIVSMNYRLGLFGFLASERYPSDKDSYSNVGLLDQRMALGWVEKHIVKFGGDRFRITVVGEGAGAGSIMHHLTAPNITRHFFPRLHAKSHFRRNFPFQSAILKSPTFQPIVPSQLAVIVTQILEKASTVKGQLLNRISKLHELPYETLYSLNLAMVRESPHGTFTFGPAVDYTKDHRSYVPDFPLRRIKAGQMAKSINILVGYRRNEGYYITPSSMKTDLGFRDHMARIFPTIMRNEIAYVSESLYPIQDYESMDQGGMNRSIEALSDLFTICNIHYLLLHMVQSYGFVLETSLASREHFLKRALMADSMIYMNDSKTQSKPNWLQDMFLRFAMFASLGAEEARVRPYDGNAKVLLASDDGFQGFINDPSAKYQCRYWADAPYGIAPPDK
ncbi:putative carboxylesterase family protein [Erysiphe necator]|uniref:Putative carboxylesterase family protein n=1 Tax=Uncinula necator TaxID=52586 RepID=A0A0B1PAA3_UNCNE|nr:putative carboxylesterase family protein [Erysiphe necator]